MNMLEDILLLVFIGIVCGECHRLGFHFDIVSLIKIGFVAVQILKSPHLERGGRGVGRGRRVGG